MKKSLLSLAALACFVQSQAQTNSESPAHMKTRKALISKIMNAQFRGNTAQKPTGTQYRVTGQAVQQTGQPVDSAAFRYSGTKGSRYNFNNRDFTYNEYFDGYYAPMPVLPGTMNPMDLLADSILYYGMDTLNDIETATYRPDNKIINATSIYIDPSDIYYSRQANGYNAQGCITTSYMLEGDPASLDTTGKRILTYNGTFTQVVSDSIFNNNGSSYEISQVAKYFYGGSGKLDSLQIYSDDNGPFGITQKISLDYYTDGKLRKTASDVYNDTGAVQFGSVDSFGYTTGAAYVTLWDTYINSISTPDVFGERNQKFPGSNGLPDSMVRYSLDAGSWEEMDRIYYSYTSFNAPQKLIFKEGGAESGQIRFYYEAYDDGLSVKPVEANKDFSIYPNPFRNNLSIDWKGQQQSTVTISLYNVIGQEVYHNALKLHTGKNELNIADLNTGNYILILHDANGKAWSSKVVKQ